jgi:hypothetical protein
MPGRGRIAYLPASVARNPGNDDADTRRPTRPWSTDKENDKSAFSFPPSSSIPIVSLFIMLTAGPTFFSKFDDDAEEDS